MVVMSVVYIILTSYMTDFEEATLPDEEDGEMNIDNIEEVSL